MSFVHGHPRRTGWVVGHVRRPNRAGQGQLPLLVVVPPSRPAAGGSGPVSSARKPAITRR